TNSATSARSDSVAACRYDSPLAKGSFPARGGGCPPAARRRVGYWAGTVTDGARRDRGHAETLGSAGTLPRSAAPLGPGGKRPLALPRRTRRLRPAPPARLRATSRPSAGRDRRLPERSLPPDALPEPVRDRGPAGLGP